MRRCVGRAVSLRVGEQAASEREGDILLLFLFRGSARPLGAAWALGGFARSVAVTLGNFIWGVVTRRAIATVHGIIARGIRVGRRDSTAETRRTTAFLDAPRWERVVRGECAVAAVGEAAD